VHCVHVHECGEHVETALHIELPGNAALEEAWEAALLVEGGELRVNWDVLLLSTSRLLPLSAL
jgi:hypothetical protein